MEKKLVNIEDNIQMTVVNNTLSVVNLVHAKRSNAEEEEEKSFFSSIESKDNGDEKVLIPIVYIPTRKKVTITSTDWISSGKGKINLDSYPEEMQKAISQSINTNKKIESGDRKIVTLADLNPEDVEKLEKSYELVENAYSSLISAIRKYKSAGMSDNVEDYALKYMFKKHLLIQGEKGGGKTYGVHKVLLDQAINYVETKGHEGIESIDMIGYYTKDDTGSMVWMDGVLTETFRKAQTEKVCLFIDEVLRIPSRELNILVGALTPMSDGTYTLRTNRIMGTDSGVASTELIRVPMENLWCVATTNVGAGYEVDEMDDALSDRFRIMVKTTTPQELESIINSHLAKKSFNESLTEKFVTFYSEMRDMVEAGQLEKFINTRHICESIDMADDESEITSYLLDLIPNWVTQETNGSLSKPEIELITKLIKRTF